MKFLNIVKKIFLLMCLFVIFRVSWGQQSSIGLLLKLSVLGNQTADESMIKVSSGLIEGNEVTYEDIQQAIKRLWSWGMFSDIKILLDQRTPDGLFMTIQVEEYPKLEEIVIEGNKKFKTDEVEKEISFFRGQVLSANQIANAKQKLLKKYAEEGYTLTMIDMKIYESEREGRAVLQITISEGEKVQIKRIQFFGNEAFDDGTLRKQLKKTKENRWWRGADFKKKEYEDDKGNVLVYYWNNGYRDAEVLKDSLYYDAEKKDMFIDIWIQEGTCYYVGDITWEGNTLFDEKSLESLLELKKGDAFSQEKLEASVNENIGGAYYDIGHIYAQIVPREVFRNEDTLDVQFILSEGNPVKIRRIAISGNTRTKDRVIRRELQIRPGDVFSKELLVRSHRDLMILNYFANVIPDVIPVDEEQLDLSFEVEEKSTDTATLSAGWSEIDRFVGNVGFDMNNLFGNGQQLSLSWNFGRYYRSFSLGFTEPYFLSTPTLIGMSIYDTKRDPYYIGYRQKSQGFSIRFGRRFRWPDNYFRGDWVYRIDRTELSDFSDYYLIYNPNNIVNEDWPLISSGITQIISRNSLDHPEFPTTGSRVSLSTEVIAKFFGGNVGYHKHVFSAEFFHPTFIPKLILLTRVQFGFMKSLGKGKNPSYLDYFFMGGSGLSQSIPLRGYDDPLAGGGYSGLGGKTMIQTTAELRFPILANPTMFGLIFAEAGNTWEDLDSTDPFDLLRSVGIGARLYMPMIGLLGIDYAYGFDQVDSSGRKYGAWKPQFVFGRSF